MNKKIIKAMFANICAKDDMRPIMGGVHFEKERCYASDGKVLVIFKEGSEKLADKTINIDGGEIEGRYPNVDSVMPSKGNEGAPFQIDFVQLKNACAYHMKKLSSNQNDKVIINDVGFNIRNLFRLLATILTGSNPRKVTFFALDRGHAVKFTAEQLEGLIMPCNYEEADIDIEQEFGDIKTLSYENFINDYVFNSWKKETKTELAWAI